MDIECKASRLIGIPMAKLALSNERYGPVCDPRAAARIETERQFLYESAIKAKNLLCDVGVDLSGYSVEVIWSHESRDEMLLMSAERKEFVIVQRSYDKYEERHPDAGILKLFGMLFNQSVQAKFHDSLQGILRERAVGRPSDWRMDATELNVMTFAFGIVFAALFSYTLEENKRRTWEEHSNWSINRLIEADLKSMSEVSPRLEDVAARSLKDDLKAATEAFEKEKSFRSFIISKEGSFIISKEGSYEDSPSSKAMVALSDLMAAVIAKVLLPYKAYGEMKLVEIISWMKELSGTQSASKPWRGYMS